MGVRIRTSRWENFSDSRTYQLHRYFPVSLPGLRYRRMVHMDQLWCSVRDENPTQAWQSNSTITSPSLHSEMQSSEHLNTSTEQEWTLLSQRQLKLSLRGKMVCLLWLLESRPKIIEFFFGPHLNFLGITPNFEKLFIVFLVYFLPLSRSFNPF